MLLTALLFAVWMWDRVLTDCHGSPETASYYYFQATVRETSASTCIDDQGQPYICTVTLPGPPVRFTSDIPDPGTGTFVSTTYDPVLNPGPLLPTPPVGGLTAWPWPSPESQPIVAVDGAGNSSGACP